MVVKGGWVNFDEEASTRLHEMQIEGRVCTLPGMGPKLLLSEMLRSYRAQMKWKLRVSGNIIMDWGAIDDSLAENGRALYENQVDSIDRKQGVQEEGTAGGDLPARLKSINNAIGTVLNACSLLHQVTLSCACVCAVLVCLHFQKQTLSVTVTHPTGHAASKVLPCRIPWNKARLAVTLWHNGKAELLNQEDTEAEERARNQVVADS